MKRETRKEREARLKGDLELRVLDIMCTAQGEDMGEEGACCLLLENYPAVATALLNRFELDDSQRELIKSFWNADNFETPEKLTDFLWNIGVRA